MADEEKKDSSGGKMKLILLALGVVVLLIAVGVAAYLVGNKSAGRVEVGATDSLAQNRENTTIGPMVNINDFIINILDKNETRYLKAAITIELHNPETAVEVTERMAQIRDAILLLIGNKTFAELSDLQGKLQLRAEIIARLNKILTKGKIKGIYFTEFVVQ
ncbi:MAG: flagellar basal body-associated FliL family protein [Desulfuromonadaceae bacterium]|nr:flagellar basal body-associated FliL family protein [Desulfuromonas sp.]MDY0184998.1 flagellar basal body-associated FliL family protein [Desulfuromonadaceae bacterium]